MRKTVLAVALISAFAVGQASAEPIHRWDGFYGGANIGGTWGQAESDTSCSSPVPFACPVAAFLGQPPTGFSADTKGVIGGGQIGYNFQYVHWVFGAEADFDWTNADGSDTRNSMLLVPFLPVSATASTSLDWLGTVRGRIGYASGDLLVYATGGLAYGKVKESFSYTASVLAFPFFSANGGGSDTQTGWTVGGGAELALDKSWSIKGEYLFYDLGSQNVSAPWTFLGVAVPGSFPMETKIDGQIARVGFNYNFH